MIRFLISATILTYFVSVSISQEYVLQGKIVDATTGEPVLGVNVIIQGTTIGTLSDLDGFYFIKVPDPSSYIEYSFIGYETQVIQAGGQTQINVSLEEKIYEIHSHPIYPTYSVKLECLYSKPLPYGMSLMIGTLKLRRFCRLIDYFMLGGKARLKDKSNFKTKVTIGFSPPQIRGHKLKLLTNYELFKYD